MRLFKSSNKSQASLDKLSGSRDHSPTQQPDPTFAHAQGYNGPPGSAYPPPQFQHQQPPQQPQQQLQRPEAYYHESSGHSGQQHPAHTLSRTQSSRAAPGVGEAYGQDQQPTVNIVPPANIPLQQQTQYVAGQTQFGQSQTVRTDKEGKKSKRGLFGFNKREDKEETSGDRRSVGRASSILKKGGPQSPLQTSPRAPSSQYSEPRSGGFDERFSNESLPQDSDQYNRYHESQEPYRPQDQYDSPSSLNTRQSVQYVEDSRYQPQHPSHPQNHPQTHPQDRQYPIYPARGSPNNSEHNLPYQGSRGSASIYDQHQSLRPPSQTSLGPPSPLIAQSQHDSRPSTSNTQQQRYSAQSQQHSIQQPQPQHLHQQGHSLPPSQQPTPQATPQPQSTQQQQQSQQLPVTPTQTSGTVPNMPRNETANGRRHEEQMYSQQDPRIRTQAHEQSTQGRSTPPPSGRNREDLSSLDYSELRAKLEELQAKYSKVKRYYFEREAQVTQLQNTVANQRLSMSKTSLDDAGYTTRFERLNGAIQNLSFNIRKDWRRIPNWLAPVCNRDAHSVGTKEMTAVGRACITRWLYESIFERIFHPGIDPNLSMHLKNIERTLRRGQYGAAMTSEQQDDMLTKITTWRLTTVEGLQDVLSSRQSEMYTETLVMSLVKQLESYLRAFLNDPPPAGLADGLASIIGQTISIAQNIPLESRDICIEYFMPGSHITEAYMKLEPGMTVLSQPGSAPTATDALPMGNDNEDQISTTSSQMDVSQNMNVEDAIRESAKAASALGQGPSVQRHESISSATTVAPKLQQQSSNTSTSSKEKKGFLGGLVNKKPALTASHNSELSKASDAPPDHHYTLQSLTNGTTDNKIRFAAFLAVEVRGRNVLKETGKEGEKSSSSSKDSEDKKDALSGAAGSGAASSGTGVQKNSANATAANILCKAPVYAFE